MNAVQIVMGGVASALAAYFFLAARMMKWRIHWRGHGMGAMKRPFMSRQGRIAVGAYCAYFATAVLVGGYCPYLMFGLPLLIIVVYLQYRSDRADWEAGGPL